MLGDKIKTLRTSNNMLQQDLANALSVSKSTVAMWETNKRIPDTSTLIKIAEYFDVTVDYLLGKDNISNTGKKEDPVEADQDLVILNRNAKKLSPENRKKLLDMAKVMFKEEFDED